MKDWFLNEPIWNSILILLLLEMGSCTTHKIYCEWADCHQVASCKGATP